MPTANPTPPTRPVDAAVLRDLLERVRALSGSDVRVDDAIHNALLPNDTWWRAICEGRRLVAAGEPEAFVEMPGIASRLRAYTWANATRVAPYTASLDAARALIARVLLGLSVESGRSGNGDPAWADIWDPMRVPNDQAWPRRILHASGSEPLACIAMLLTVLLTTAEPHHADTE